MLEIKNLRFSYKSGDLIFDGADLKIDKGCYFIGGANGSGKTTLIRILTKLAQNLYKCEMSGEIYLNGKKDFKPVVVSQNIDSCVLYDTAYEEIRFFSLNSDFIFRNPDDFFKSWKLEDFKTKNTNKLSYGEKQKYLISVALSFLNRDNIICLDEPFAFLDDENVLYIKNLIKKLKNEFIVLFFGHNQDEVFDIADSFFVIKNKKIIPLDYKDTKIEIKKSFKYKNRNNTVLKCEGISHNYMRKKISFEIKSGELKVLYAPNGSGKTTLVKILSGICEDYSGSLYLKGSKANRSALLESVFCVLSNPDAQLIARTVREFLGNDNFYLELLKRVGLESKMDCYISHLSYGEKQKLLILYSIFKKKDLIIIDEPFMSFDYETEVSILNLIDEYLKNEGSVIISTPKRNFFDYLDCDIIDL